MALMVVGTDTDIGKTITCAVIAARYGHAMLPVVYWKPIATGVVTRTARKHGSSHESAHSHVRTKAHNVQSHSDQHTIQRLCGDRVHVLDGLYRYELPASPHLAARRARRPICIDTLQAQTQHYLEAYADPPMIIEGVGGVLVPLHRETLLIDYLAELEQPVVIVASSRVGTINHTLLTLEALRTRRIEPIGVIMNGPRHRDNEKTISTLGRTQIIATLPTMLRITPMHIRNAARTFDRKNALEPFLSHVSSPGRRGSRGNT